MKTAAVTVTTATKLSSAQKKMVREMLEQKLGKVEITEKVDAAMLGGLKISLGNQEFDASLSGKLEKLESQVDEVQVTTAVELSSAQRKKLSDALEKKFGASMKINEVIDPTILGGIRVVMGSKEIDASVKTKLDKLRQQLLQTI